MHLYKMKMTTVAFLMTYLWRHTFTFPRVYSTVKTTFANQTDSWNQENDRSIAKPISRRQGNDTICGVDSFEKNYYDCDAENQENYKFTSGSDDQAITDYKDDVTDNDYTGQTESVTEYDYVALVDNKTIIELKEIKQKKNPIVNCAMASCSTVVFIPTPASMFINMTTAIMWLSYKPRVQKLPTDFEFKKTVVTFTGKLSSTEPPIETEPPPKLQPTRSTTLRTYASTTKSSPKYFKALNSQKRFMRKLRAPT